MRHYLLDRGKLVGYLVPWYKDGRGQILCLKCAEVHEKWANRHRQTTKDKREPIYEGNKELHETCGICDREL